MDYEEYDKQKEENRIRNDKLLDEFKEWLLLSGLSKKTIDKHIDNVYFYINEYLTYSDVEPAESGYLMIDGFLGDWFIRKAMWSSETSIKSNIASFKKFYLFLKEKGLVSELEYSTLLQIIKDEKDNWIRALQAYDDGDMSAFYGDLDWLGFDEDEDDEDDSKEDDYEDEYYEDEDYEDENDEENEDYYEYFESFDEYQKCLEKFFTILKSYSEIKPWEWLGDTDIFAVRFDDEYDPYFCCVLGNAGEVFGISLYKGIDGLESYFKILNGEYGLDNEIHIMDATSIYFDDRKDISKEDYEMIKQSGVSFRGKKKWPSIKVFEPGFIPDIIDVSDIEDIMRVMEVVIEYVLYLKENMEKASLMKEGRFLLREYEGSDFYKESIVEYDDFFRENESEIDIPILYNEMDIKRVLKNCKKTSDVWELGSFFLDFPVDEGRGEPFFPVVLLIVELGMGLVLGYHMSHPYDTEDFQLCLLDTISNNGIIPKKVIVTDSLNTMILYDIFEQLNIEVEVVKELMIIPQIKNEML